MLFTIVLSLFLVQASALECNMACPMNLDMHCGSDGVTYSNLCALEVENCMTRSNVQVVSAGECPEPKEVEEVEECMVFCHRNLDPVCGTDGITYSNACLLKAKACESRSDLQIAQMGECQVEEEIDSSCIIPCQFIRDPVCGTDGQTYGNQCAMETEACLQRSMLQVAHKGEC